MPLPGLSWASAAVDAGWAAGKGVVGLVSALAVWFSVRPNHAQVRTPLAQSPGTLRLVVQAS